MRKLIAGLLLTAVSLATSAGPAAATVISPVGLAPGAQYQLIFVTKDSTSGSSADINSYNIFAQGEASMSASLPLATWHAVVSTATVNANLNAAWAPGLPVYNTGGIEVASGANGLYAGGLLNPIRYDQFGTPLTSTVWTGSDVLGNANNPLGAVPFPETGLTSAADGTWIQNQSGASSASLPFHVYALSTTLTVPAPEPGSIVIACMAAAGFATSVLLGHARRR